MSMVATLIAAYTAYTAKQAILENARPLLRVLSPNDEGGENKRFQFFNVGAGPILDLNVSCNNKEITPSAYVIYPNEAVPSTILAKPDDFTKAPIVFKFKDIHDRKFEAKASFEKNKDGITALTKFSQIWTK